MDVEICKACKCTSLNKKRTKDGFMYRCYLTPRNQTLRNIESCGAEPRFGIRIPKLKEKI